MARIRARAPPIAPPRLTCVRSSSARTSCPPSPGIPAAPPYTRGAPIQPETPGAGAPERACREPGWRCTSMASRVGGEPTPNGTKGDAAGDGRGDIGIEAAGGEVRTWSRRSSAATVATALGVGAAYYLGSTDRLRAQLPSGDLVRALAAERDPGRPRSCSRRPGGGGSTCSPRSPAHALVELRAGFPVSLVAAALRDELQRGPDRGRRRAPVQRRAHTVRHAAPRGRSSSSRPCSPRPSCRRSWTPPRCPGCGPSPTGSSGARASSPTSSRS